MSDNPMLRSAFSHEQTPRTATYYVVNRFKRRQRARRVTEPVPPVPAVEQLAAPDNLIATYYEMKGKAGEAPGPDGVTYGDLSRREVADLFRELSNAVLGGTYRPGPVREVKIPKLSGGHRTLRVGNLADRVLAAALNRAMEPVWEPVFLPFSMGFRPRRGVWRLLAELEAAITREGRTVVAIDDIKDAFPSVVIDDVLTDHARHLQDPPLLSLIDTVLRGGDGHTKGIDQGSPYSPTALNVRLHHAHDLGARQGHLPPWFRYADNLVYLCKGVSEGHQALHHVRQMLEPAGFFLKGKDGVTDLQRGEAQLLGFTLSWRRGRLLFDLGSDAWTKLEQNLVQAHKAEDPSQTARKAVHGWVEAFGPAFESWRIVTLDRILQRAAKLGFREIDAPRGLTERAEAAQRHWDTYRQRVLREAEKAEGAG
jgi:RNA-directed DNA polymerase